MNEENFKKGIEELKEIHMTNVEKTRMLEKVFSAPIKSPYMRRIPVFTFVYSNRARVVFASCLIFVFSLGGAVYSSDKSLPGDLLYPIKTRVVESTLDFVNSAPEKKIVWEEEKITRRIVEAEKLLEKDELDDKKLEKLERSIEKSSRAFTKAANIVASSTSTSTLSRKEKANELRRNFRGRIKVESEQKVEDIEETDTEQGSFDRNKKSTAQRQKIKRLKDTAIRVVDDEEESRNRREDNEKSRF